MRRRWLVAATGAAVLVTSAAVAALGLAVLPDQRTTSAHTVLDTSPATPAPGPATGSPSGAPPTTTPPGTTPSTTGASGAPTQTITPHTASGPARLASRIRPGVTYRGVATFYGADGGGNCMFDPTGDVMVVAMNRSDYEDSRACGAYLSVRGPSGTSITVRVVDQCPECPVGALDLSAQAFAKLAAPSAGRINVTWKLSSPGMSGPIAVRYKTGSTRYWCAVQVLNHRNPIAALDLQTSTGWKSLPRQDYNYFLSESGTGCGGSIRVTDIYGQRITLTGITIKPDVVQQGSKQFMTR